MTENVNRPAEKRAYFETHEPPHCPTCDCGAGVEPTPQAEVLKLRAVNRRLREKNKLYRKALNDLCVKGRCPIAEEALGL